MPSHWPPTRAKMLSVGEGMGATKAAVRELCQSYTGDSESEVGNKYAWTWQVKASLRVQCLVWRIARNILLVKRSLVRRGLHLNSMHTRYALEERP